MSRADHARELRLLLADPAKLCRDLGIAEGAKKQARGLSIRCPVHGEKDPSCSVTLGRDHTVRVRCFACDWTADALGLVAAVYGLSTRGDGFREVLVEAARLAGREDIADEIAGDKPRADRPRVQAPPPAPEPTYPPTDTVRALWNACVPVTDDAEVSGWLVCERRIDPELVAGRGLARTLPTDVEVPPWATYRRQPWNRTGHRLIFPMFDATGRCRSVRACRVTAGETPKRLPPAAHKAAELVMANRPAFGMLLGRARPRTLIVVEGEPDFLVAATRYPDAAVGIVSGSWTSSFAARVPTGCRVAIWTDPDAAGDRYAEAIATSLGNRAECWRAA